MAENENSSKELLSDTDELLQEELQKPGPPMPVVQEDGSDETLLAESDDAALRAVPVLLEEGHGHMPALPYPVVGMGASAGGLQAFREIIENLPPDTGMAYVLVTHLAPDQKSFLVEIVKQFAKMPVEPIEDGIRPEPNHIYILLPNQTVQMVAGMFRLQQRRPSDKVVLSIDLFFKSLAEDQKNHAIGVVLSGADSDGALGLRAIKGEGGIALVQAPETAQHSSMPRNSIAADHVDLVVAPRDLAVELARLGKQFSRPELRSLEEEGTALTDQQSFLRILQMIRSMSGIDLRQYKAETIRRRVARRMMLLRMESLADYGRYLQLRSDELKMLQEDVLINVTKFFRDASFWQALRTEILPMFFSGRPPEKQVRIWCAGCATGEEAYSYAILLLEYFGANHMDTTVQIFATDVSDTAIDTARAAVYPETLMSDVSADRLRRFFVKTERGYQVSKRVRDCCIFARQNLASDPPFSHIDLLSCRNVLIYFKQTLQRQIMATFHYALDPSGYMLLGMSESLRDHDEAFIPVDRKNKIYRRSAQSLPAVFRLPITMPAPQPSHNILATPYGEVWPELELQRAADRIVLARFGPAGLIVDDRLNVLQARGQTSPYVELTAGAVSWNLTRVLRESIADDVRTSVERSIHENIPVTRIAMAGDEENQRQVQIDVLPITSASARTRCFMILFSEVDADRRAESLNHARLPELTLDEKERLIAQLRQDLASTRFHLQSLVEERDARNQELVSANEEIQSANEELQSTNEELETTKEELQSANEELQTVNDELQQRNSVLMQTGNDLNNLLTSVNIPLLMLTETLHIRQFTPPMERLLSIRAGDIGRSISEIRLQLSIEDIEPILHEVLDTLGTREIEVKDRDGKWNLLRVRPYRTAENKIEGLVVVLVDIDQLRSSQGELREARDFADSVVQSVPVPVVVLAKDCTIRTVNNAFRLLTQLQSRELLDRSLPDIVQYLWGLDGFKDKLNDLVNAEAGAVLEFEHESMTYQKKTLLIKGQALFTDGDRVVLLTMEDITSRREAERMIAKQNEALEKEVELTGRTLTRAQEELRDLAAHLFSVQEEERQRVARELHDDVAQRLSALQMIVEQIRLEEPGAGKDRLKDSIRDRLAAINTDVRQISHRLHPTILSDLGLSAALKALVEDFRDRESMFATYISTDVPDNVPQHAATAVYRITQEALRNVAKHAGKTHVKVVLEGSERMLRLEVRDFGIGFDMESEVPHRGLGLISMKERARIAQGTLTIESALGEGTTVCVDLPLPEHA